MRMPRYRNSPVKSYSTSSSSGSSRAMASKRNQFTEVPMHTLSVASYSTPREASRMLPWISSSSPMSFFSSM